MVSKEASSFPSLCVGSFPDEKIYRFSCPFFKNKISQYWVSKLNLDLCLTRTLPRPAPLHAPTVLTCVTPAGDVTVAGLFEHPLPLHGQTGGENVTTERHALPGRVAHHSRRQAHQGQVVVVAVGVIARVGDDLIHGVLLLVLLRDQGMVVAHSDLVLLGAVTISAAKNRGTKGRQALLEKKGGTFLRASVFTGDA